MQSHVLVYNEEFIGLYMVYIYSLLEIGEGQKLVIEARIM